jgi:ribosomal-protein-alanine N-acetyltransferase
MVHSLNLETDRLMLRPINLLDAPAIKAGASNRKVAEAMLSIPHPYPEKEAERYISRQIAGFETGYSVTFVIERKFVKVFSGIIEIRSIEREHSQAELSFWLVFEEWGKGYMTEALKPVLHFSFENLNLNRLYAYHMVRNVASGRVLQKNGFMREGVLKQRVRKWGVLEDAALWAILREDWQGSAS